MLDEHPEVVSGSESHLFPALYRTLAKPVGGSQRTREVLQRFDARTERASSVGGTGPHGWVDRAALERLLDQAVERDLNGDDAARFVIGSVFDSFLERNQGEHGRVLVEKTPRHLRFADRILSWWPEALIIELVRDGRDVCASLDAKSKVRSWASADRGEQIAAWVDAIRKGEELRATPAASGRWLVVRFEDLVADAPGEIARLYDFVGLAFDADSVARVADATSIANARRMGASHHLRVGRVGTWRDHFTDADQKLFEQQAGDVLVSLGYQL